MSTPNPNPNPNPPKSNDEDEKKIVVGGAEFDTSEYVGVSQEYQNYADKRHKPLAAEPDDEDDHTEADLVDAIKHHEEENSRVEGEVPETNPDNLADGRR